MTASAGKRRRERDAIRRAAFEALYAEELGGALEIEGREASLLAHAVRLNLNEIDAKISEKLRPGFAVNRLNRPDRVLLRLGMAELLFEKSPSSVLAGYTDLAAEFGDEKSPGFVNGLLAAVAQEPSVADDPSAESS
ncbi:MAG: transcription antitermination protein NusB [Actinomycetota bacterium]